MRTPNPLAIGVDLGGMLPEHDAPRPKPRAGLVPELSLRPARAITRTLRDGGYGEYDSAPVASGSTLR